MNAVYEFFFCPVHGILGMMGLSWALPALAYGTIWVKRLIRK